MIRARLAAAVAAAVGLLAGQTEPAQESTVQTKKSSPAKKKRSAKKSSADAQAPAKKKSSTSAKSAAKKKSSTSDPAPAHKSASASQHPASKSSKSKKTVVAPRGQQRPTPERYKQIEEALAARGYLHEEATGKWGPNSVEALRSFQADHQLPPTGRLDALSLTQLGLGSQPQPQAQP